jgi:hypothetical protein
VLATSEKGYTVTRLIKSSGLLADISLLLSAWDESKSTEDNFDAAIRRNVFGKSSRQRVAELLRVFRQRYLPQDGSDYAFRIFVGSSLASEVTNPVVYYQTALAEPAFYDFVTGYLRERYLQGERAVTVRNGYEFVREAIRAGKTEGTWDSENTRMRVAQGLMSTARDFGVLSGTPRSPERMITAPYLPILSFAYIAFHIKRLEASGEKLVNHPHWRLFFLPPHEVENRLAEADAEKLLSYQAAGSIVRIEFPTTDFTEYAHALVGRTV